MKSIRLNQNIRDNISGRLISERFKKQFEELQDQWRQLAMMVYIDAIPIKELNIAKKLPDHWLPTVDDIKVSFDGNITYLPLKEDVIVPASKAHCCIISYDKDHELTTHYHVLKDARDSLHGQKVEARKHIMSVLGSVTTTKKLIEVWPQIEEVVMAVLPKEPAPVPALPIKKINDILGL